MAYVAVATATAAVINGTISTLAKDKVYKAQVNQMDFQNRLGQLNSQQQLDLAMQLQNAQSDNEKFKILQSTVAQMDVATATGNASILAASVGAQSKNSMTTAIIIGASLVALIGAAYFLTKKD
jgi:hypothetical protein